MRLRTRTISAALVPLLFLALLTGCEEDVVAVVGTNNVFTIYGVFSPQLDTQRVRLFPIEGRLQLRDNERPDAEFFSTNLQTGEEREWVYEPIHEPDGRYEHSFSAGFSPEYGHSYRLEARRSDGAVSAATVTVPPRAELVREETAVGVSVIVPIHLQGEVPRLLKPEVEYLVRWAPEAPVSPIADVVIPIEDRITRVDGGWLIRMNLSADYAVLRDTMRVRSLWHQSFGLQLIRMEIRLMAVADDWNPPNGEFDPQVLVQPGTLSNVENGFGFIGAGYRLNLVWLPPNEVTEPAGFRPILVPQDP